MNEKEFPIQPGELERIGVSFKKRLLTADYVVSATYTITDKDGNDVTDTHKVAASEQISDQDGDGIDETASIDANSFVDGKDYTLDILATTNLGKKLEGERFIICREEKI